MGNWVVIPFKLIDKILQELHDNHSGMVMIIYTASLIDRAIEDTVGSCQSCQILQKTLAGAPLLKISMGKSTFRFRGTFYG